MTGYASQPLLPPSSSSRPSATQGVSRRYIIIEEDPESGALSPPQVMVV